MIDKNSFIKFVKDKSSPLKTEELKRIIEEELSKDEESMDTERIEMCLDALDERNALPKNESGKKKSHVRKWLMRAASVVLVIFIGFTVLNLSVTGVREKTFSVISNISGGGVLVIDSSDPNVVKLAKYKGKYIPSYIPKGYLIKDVNNYSGVYIMTLSNGDYNISYTEDHNSDSVNINNENCTVEETLTINGYKCYYNEVPQGKDIVIFLDDAIVTVTTSDKAIDLKGFVSLIEER